MVDNCSTSVYSWFEKSGVVSDVRTHLRHKLISALKHKEPITRLDDLPKSVNKYICNLLVAEYLYQNDYDYSLSVFASEAPLLFNVASKTKCKSRSTGQNGKLLEECMQHILGFLDIHHDTQKRIVNRYKNNEESLLFNILENMKCLKGDEEILTNPTKDQNIQASKNELEENSVESGVLEKELTLKQQTAVIEKQMFALQHKLKRTQELVSSLESSCDQSKEKPPCHKRKSKQISQDKLISVSDEDKRFQKFQKNMTAIEKEFSQISQKMSRLQSSKPVLKDSCIQTNSSGKVSPESLKKTYSFEKNDLTEVFQKLKTNLEELIASSKHLGENLELKTSPNHNASFKDIFTHNETSSITDNILEEAKNHLRKLEEESLIADSYYNKYINNFTTTELR